MKRLKEVVLIIVSILLVWSGYHETSIRVAFNMPRYDRDVENPNSEIIKSLVGKNDFPSDFKWFQINIFQSSILPNNDNYFQTEEASIALFGYWNDDKVLLDNTISRYQVMPNFAEIINVSGLKPDTAFPEYFAPELINVSELQTISCRYENSVTTNCVLLISQGEIVTGFYLYVKRIVDADTLSDFFNFLLEK